MTTTSVPLTAGLQALDVSSDRLAKHVDDLTPDDLNRPSSAHGWRIADVLSHLGSAAEICTVLARRSTRGDTTAPTRELVEPIWDRWNQMSPARQRSAWRDADTGFRALLSTLDPATRVPYFSGLLDLGEFVGYRLSEQSVHGWDIEVVSDPGAAIPQAELELLWGRLELVVSRFHDGETRDRLAPARIAIELVDTAQRWWLEVDDGVHLHPGTIPDATATMRGDAQPALLTIYGRSRTNDRLQFEGAISGNNVTSLFPGY